MTTSFNPADHLTSLKGKSYLEVKWRLVWLNDYCERQGLSFSVESEVVQLDLTKGFALVRAEVVIARDGQVIKRASGLGSEESSDFGDFIEKAETKAIGRALAVLGFGTQFTGDDLEGVIADAPVTRPRPRFTFHGKNQS
jgi:hypothetical protein